MSGAAGPPPGAAPGPLAGLRVVELGGIGPVPFAAMVLSDLGAEVVRVHRPADRDTPPNPVLDRGRRSLIADLKDPRGAAVVHALIDRSDAVLEGFRPGVAERLGFDPPTLAERNARLVFGRMTGFGQDGPLAARAGHDINYIALSGALGAIGRPGRPPVPPLNLVGDFGGGGMLLALGVLAAVLNARATGRGQTVDAAMVEGSGLLMSMIFGRLAGGAWTVDRGANVLDGGAPFYDSYECADGRYVAVGAIEAGFFAGLVDVLGVADRIDLAAQRDPSTWPAMRDVFTEAFRSATRDEWTARFAGIDACVTPVLTMDEVLAHPHNADRGSFFTDSSGAIHPAPAPRFAGTPCATPSPAPVPGGDTRALLSELGHPPEDIDKLLAEGVVS
ncbi:CaiB/BaiF CoA-transferase family protein [Actinomadura sp. WMMB 499]|uniref:CaiB/BaiF CoA transferase family protein n=1 Tax=Actinomadura sp. WMMB 499 TaxID=1219491 RepID=UPI001244C950|nr:CaiB/BaiF CoA-transferase family protein [Actinomadura sp. WMMB 499]QFG22221.1 CoA transferase [Actinomadura sp. WMMB 499]